MSLNDCSHRILRHCLCVSVFMHIFTRIGSGISRDERSLSRNVRDAAGLSRDGIRPPVGFGTGRGVSPCSSFFSGGLSSYDLRDGTGISRDEIRSHVRFGAGRDVLHVPSAIFLQRYLTRPVLFRPVPSVRPVLPRTTDSDCCFHGSRTVASTVATVAEAPVCREHGTGNRSDHVPIRTRIVFPYGVFDCAHLAAKPYFTIFLATSRLLKHKRK